MEKIQTQFGFGGRKKPRLTSLYDKYNVRGAAISAVDLIKGIGICAGLDAIDVPELQVQFTNFEGRQLQQ